MKCYYEVLSVARDAEDAEIKTAYKKLALRYHPDKNLDNTEEAKEQFQLVQQAYEVLIDRQERAWYDNHREQILRGCDKDFEDKSVDVFQYFTTSCFKGFNDNEDGFYAVYRKVFETIAKEDLEYMDNKEDFMGIPQFGTSNSDYEEVVGPFYAYWSGYSTSKSYVWLDPYDIRETKERRVLKLIEKENKKVRTKAKKERNEEVRNLVAFMRKRDKRVQKQAKKLEKRAKENKLKQEELSKQKRMERRKEIRESGNSAEWANFNNVKNELKEIEKSLAEEFGEEISGSEDESIEDDDSNSLYCIACSKLFKTPKAFQNHELSKKHKENVEKLKQEMLDDEELSRDSELDYLSAPEEVLTEEDESRITVKSHDIAEVTNEDKKKLSKSFSEEDLQEVMDSGEEVKSVEDEVEDSELMNEENKNKSIVESDVNQEEEDIKVFNKKNKKKSRKVLKAESEEDVPIHLEEETETPNVEGAKRQKKKQRKKRKDETDSNTAEEQDCEDRTEFRGSKKNKKKQAVSNGEIVEDLNHCCVSCKSKFDSKNKLFQHLKKSGHGVYLPKEQKIVEGKKKGIK